MLELCSYSSPQLINWVGKVFIIAYQESTQQLEEAIAQAGFSCEVLRQEHQPEQQEFSPSYLCLLNHRQAWQRATQTRQLTLIVEADFVPVVGLGCLPLPFDPRQTDVGIAWLYTCAAQVYSLSKEGYAQGFSTSMVAYIVTPQSAECLLELAEKIRARVAPKVYSAWDSEVCQFLDDRQLKTYIPFRNYGEHGGYPNPEHRQQGLSAAHRADVLYGKLAFMPLYATGGSHAELKLMRIRLFARAKGLARLVRGKFLRLKVMRTSSVPIRLISFAIRRQLSGKI